MSSRTVGVATKTSHAGTRPAPLMRRKGRVADFQKKVSGLLLDHHVK